MSRKPAVMAVALAILTIVVAAACADRTPSLEERAFALDRQIMCPVCDGQTIDQSAHEISRQMRDAVRERLAAGDSDAEVKAYFAARYGEGILAAPEPRGFNALVWFAPPVGLAIGAGMLALIMRAMRRQPEAASSIDEDLGPTDSDGLSPYLEQVDLDLGIAVDGRSLETQRKPEGGSP